MRLTSLLKLAFLLPLGGVLVLETVACIDVVESDGAIEGLTGGALRDTAEELSPERAQGSCTDAGAPGNPCMTATTCCGASQGSEVCAFGGGASGVCKTPSPLGTASTWSSLYADYFGGSGRASCAGNGQCHGSTSQPGYMQVQYLCPPSDAKACWTSLTSTSLGLIQPDTAFDDDSLYEYIRKPAALAGTGLNDMPKAPTEVYEFTEADLARITAWVAAGAHND